MNTNALEWYKKTVKNIMVNEEYLRNVFISFYDTQTKENEDKDLIWLFNEYDPSCYDTLCVDDEISFSNDGTSLHNITIWVKEKWSRYEW